MRSLIRSQIPKKIFSTKQLRFFSAEKFFTVGDTQDLNEILSGHIAGEIIDAGVDLRTARPGSVIEVPYEISVGNSIRDFWQSAFYSHDRINTSTPFARKLGFQDQVLPYGLMVFLCAAMSHADQAKVQVGFQEANYHWPAFAGDTFKKRFIIRSLRSTSKGDSVFHIGCELINQRDRLVFSCEKQMLFPFTVPPSNTEVPKKEVNEDDNDLLAHLIGQSEVLQTIGSQTLRSVRPGQLILHKMTRPLSVAYSMQLSSLARLTHDRHFNTAVYSEDELYIPGGLVLALTCAQASRDLHEVLYEKLDQCIFPVSLHPKEPVSSITFVKSLKEHVSGDMEQIKVRTIGVKGIDTSRELIGKQIPLELLTGPLLRPKAFEELLEKECPELSKKCVCVADRTLYRQAPKHVPFLL